MGKELTGKENSPFFSTVRNLSGSVATATPSDDYHSDRKPGLPVDTLSLYVEGPEECRGGLSVRLLQDYPPLQLKQRPLLFMLVSLHPWLFELVQKMHQRVRRVCCY